jgi:8-oxo-dGTP pyrophosphatase MutT (NUDIX family)
VLTIPQSLRTSPHPLQSDVLSDDDLLPAALEASLRRRLQHPLPGAAAQRRFAPAPDLTPDTARRAAALILLYPGPMGWSIPLTLRRADLPQHAGQVSLPGGALDPGESPEDAALRETYEEIGVPPSHIRLLGPLSTLWVIVSNFVLHPFVGVADTRPDFLPAPREVAKILEVPLRDILNPARMQWSRQSRLGTVVDYPHLDLEDHIVWGATAMVLGEFACLFDPAHGPGERPEQVRS